GSGAAAGQASGTAGGNAGSTRATGGASGSGNAGSSGAATAGSTEGTAGSSAGSGAGGAHDAGSTGSTGSGSAGSSGTTGTAGSASGATGTSTGATTGSAGNAGDAGSHGDASSGATSGTSGTTGDAGGDTCGAGDTNLPAEPTFPAVCTTLTASQNVSATGVAAESNFDTTKIQTALTGCASGQAVKLVAGGGNNAFITGPITVPSGVTLWVDAGATLYGTRDPNVYGSASALITVKGSKSGIVGDGTIDGQGGEPMIGSTSSFWDQNGNGGSSPALIQVSGATNFTLYRITLHNAPMFHVKLSAAGFVVWGITIKTPSKATNSAGTALTVSSAHNTDGVDPGESASNGYIVCNKISDGDDHIAIKGSSSTGVTNLTIAHNHFEAGHGMSIGSEFTGGVSNVNVYDLSIDGSLGGYANGIRIKSDSSRGGLVNDVTYSDVCVRDLETPILLTPFYTTDTGSDIPQFTNIKIQNFHALSGPSNQQVTFDGYSTSYINTVTLDNVVIDGITASEVEASYTTFTLGPGNVNFMPSGTSVTVKNDISGSSTPNPCTGKWVTF
ncbi:MAG TPA: glycosyl hydrolase family 28 protein, partial [Polyangiaceae bacterium]|nr:glycosyl hydrolase family 28 protein [Polyangiaceae bacterium]